MASVFRKVRDWLKYEQLHHYPALASFDRDAALKRLQGYRREERAACRHWLITAYVLVVLLWVLWSVVVWIEPAVAGLMLFAQIPGWALQYALYLRVNRRVEAKIAAELADGRLWTCFECGYDLRASTDRCPECGTPVRIAPPAAG